MIERIKVTFLGYNKEIYIEKGKSIMSAALSCGIHLNSVCAGEGICGKCKIKLRRGEVDIQNSDAISTQDLKYGFSLACLTYPRTNVVVEIPKSSRIEPVLRQEIYSKAKTIKQVDFKSQKCDFSYLPVVKKIYLELPKPSLIDNINDLDRVLRELSKYVDINNIKISLNNSRNLSNVLRKSDWKITLTIGEYNETYEILNIEQADTSSSNFGFAFDIGTTTISGELIDLKTQKVLGAKLTYNKQASFGADVITRIVHAKNAQGLERLHKAVIEGINEIIENLISEFNIDINDVTCLTCAGNTTMIHLLMRIDPSFIRREPYIPAITFLSAIKAHEIGIQISTHGLLYIIAGISSYLGGDITSGILASGIYKEQNPCLLIDIGTNGEIILGNKEFLIGCAASAGPAFEGSGVTSGMKATRGAIEKVKIDKNLNITLQTIDNVKPIGICGSGYINLIAEMLKAKILDKNGKISIVKNKRVKKTKVGLEFKIEKNIVITEADIDNIKRSKAAIYAAIITLLEHMQLNFDSIDKIFIAGGFGNYIDIEQAITIGLLPDIDRNKFIFIGNSSLNGAKQAILSNTAFKKTREIAKQATYFELSTDSKYMNEYTAALFFPHTDKKRFQTINI
ncbi:MAG: ASKHA domain-containing protein [Candidatus Omnitrophota bacterium]